MKIVCIGAGPAGLTAAYFLTKQGHDVTVLETHPRLVGGIARTEEREGYRFDIGGHRFFSKSEFIEHFWHEILGQDFIKTPRSSQIYYRQRFFSYPIAPFQALRRLGIIESTICMLSFLKAKLFPIRNPVTYQDWVINQFGKRFFNMFFKSYTEKVWGMKCDEISAEWAQKRIKGLSFFSAIRNAVIKPRNGQVIKSLIEHFHYPKLGPGMMWEAVANKVAEQNGKIIHGANVSRIHLDQGRTFVEYQENESTTHTIEADHVISSTAMRDLILQLIENVPSEVRKAAEGLKYRDFISVALVVEHLGNYSPIGKDNWIYVHDPDVTVGRIQNFKRWSPHMVQNPDHHCYGMEYFTNEGSEFWNLSDDQIVEHAKNEMLKLGLMEPEEFVKGFVVRQTKAYPVYDEDYQKAVTTVRKYLETHLPQIHLVGRNGMHRYNNQDHSMMTAYLASENIKAGYLKYDVWAVDSDAEYHEEVKPGSSVSGFRDVPSKIRRPEKSEDPFARDIHF